MKSNPLCKRRDEIYGSFTGRVATGGPFSIVFHSPGIGEEAQCGYAGGMKFGGTELVGLIVAVSFAAGLNVYATVATLGC